MRFSVAKLPKSQVEIFFEVSPEEFNRCREKAVLNLSQNFKMPGFREGKVPKEIIERELGEDKIREEAVELAVGENYFKAISENNIEAIGKPEITVTKAAKGNPLEFKAVFSVLPEINLPDYRKIASEIKKEEVKVEEKDIKETLEWIRKSRAKLTLKSGLCQKGDFVEISYSSPEIETGKEFKDGFILGEGHFAAGFEDNLEGMKSGEEKEFSIDFPKEKEGTNNLAGKTITFKVKIANIQNVELPEITDEWAKTLGNFENLGALKENVAQGIQAEKEAESNKIRRSKILEKITGLVPLETPEILIETDKKQILNNLKESVQDKLKISFEDYLGKIRKTEAEIKESFKEESSKRVKNYLVLREIAKKENVGVPEKEVEEKINEFLKKYPSAKKAEKEVDLGKLKSYYEDTIREEKTFQLLEQQ